MSEVIMPELLILLLLLLGKTTATIITFISLLLSVVATQYLGYWNLEFLCIIIPSYLYFLADRCVRIQA